MVARRTTACTTADRAITRPGSAIPPVRAASAARAAALASPARASPAVRRAVTSRAACSPEMTSRRSVSRAAETWKYMAMADRKPAAHLAVAVWIAAPLPPLPKRPSLARLPMGPAATTRNTTGTTMISSKLNRVAAIVGQQPADEQDRGHRGTALPFCRSIMRSKRSWSARKWLMISPDPRGLCDRDPRVPFFKSRPSLPMPLMPIAAVIAPAMPPYTGLAHLLGFGPAHDLPSAGSSSTCSSRCRRRPLGSDCARGGVRGWALTGRVMEDSVPEIPDGLVQLVHGVTDLAAPGMIAHQFQRCLEV
jgi:hypothetical protein